MIFDRDSYLTSLAHLGRLISVPGLPYPVLLRRIPNTRYEDAMGPWPYGSAPDTTGLPDTFAFLRDLGVITFTGFIRPDARFDRTMAERAGFAVAPLKPHFIVNESGMPLSFRRRTRRHLAMARRHWTIDLASLDAGHAAVAMRLHLDLQRRREMSAMTRMPAEHFLRLADTPGIAVLAARDSDGIGGLVIAACEADETHLLHFLVLEHALRTSASYLLMASAIEVWGRNGRVYLGGAPSGRDGPGIARFKARWANRTASVSLLTAILQEDTYRALGPEGSRTPFFPNYRNPGLDDAESQAAPVGEETFRA
jgi:hypothetical protein